MFLAVVLVVIILISGVGIFWFFIWPNIENTHTATVDFWLEPKVYVKNATDNWGTEVDASHSILNATFSPFSCKNDGDLNATFDIIVVFSGVSVVPPDTQSTYQQINSTAAKFTFTLEKNQEKTANVPFTITSNDTFSISLSLQSSQSTLRIRIQPQNFGVRQLYFGFMLDKGGNQVFSPTTQSS